MDRDNERRYRGLPCCLQQGACRKIGFESFITWARASISTIKESPSYRSGRRYRVRILNEVEAGTSQLAFYLNIPILLLLSDSGVTWTL